MRRTSVPAVALLLATVAGVSACAPEESGGEATPAASGTVSCDPGSMKTLTAGKLTIGTDQPAYEPWFKDDKPESGEGFESAVAYAVATQLGYTKENVVWTRVRFDSAIAPGPKSFDIDINQFSITEERRKAVDFSSPYYLVRQAVVAKNSSRIAGATGLAGLKDAKLGAQVGTTSYQAITELVKPSQAAQVFNSNDDAKQALENGTIDGLVVDLPTAFYMTAAELTDAKIVGQMPQVGTQEGFGIVLDQGSSLTGCVTQAVDALRTDGTLTTLEKQWLAQVAGAPELS
ncbi:polar amino acid transport system substrate-binding protein [Catenuloplanes nepalensis]|uniref:Polar amino acid transport system substrate-binding protein n=2 Tax=Catenuloplanes nepalensis TaxID=587533 RepID=A0ABT9MX63_9ACTN|nr:ABC transporter substrate-binding protein [Catenuloplanes nepalensis]MDP9795975.1 polar amino acid transport system substrate-binding protein [Catenuloplanes nepalensis]